MEQIERRCTLLNWLMVKEGVPKKLKQQLAISGAVPHSVILLTLLTFVLTLFGGCTSREERLWEKTRKANTVEAYEAFLKEFPSDDFSAPAQAQLRRLREPDEWRKAESKDTIESYRTFLREYPDGKNSSLANSRLTELEKQKRLARIRSSPTVEAMSSYLDDYPLSPEAREVRTWLRPLLLAEALSRKTINLYEEFLTYFPQDSAAPKIRSLLRPVLREEVNRKGTALAFSEFLNYFPEDPEAADFRLRMEISILASKDQWPVSRLRSLRSRKYELALPPHLLGLFALSLERIGSFDTSPGVPRVTDISASERRIFAALGSGRPISLDVCYFTKANQLYFSDVVSTLLSRAVLSSYLEGWSLALKERNTEPVSPDQVIESQSEIDEFNAMVQAFNGKESEREFALRSFNERLQVFSGLLPLEELSTYSSIMDSLRTSEVKPRGLPVPVFPMNEALVLIRSGYVKEGLVLLDAIGKIKLAYLGVLLAGNQDDYFQSGKVEVLETDLRRYYNFVEQEVLPLAPPGSGGFPETLSAYASEVQSLHSLDSFKEELQEAKSRGMRRSNPWP